MMTMICWYGTGISSIGFGRVKLTDAAVAPASLDKRSVAAPKFCITTENTGGILYKNLHSRFICGSVVMVTLHAEIQYEKTKMFKLK